MGYDRIIKMKYTKQEQKKLDQLKRLNALSRASISQLVKHGNEVLRSKQGILRKFKQERRKIERQLDIRESKIRKNIRDALRPFEPKYRKFWNVIDINDNRIHRIKSVVNDRIWAARKAKRQKELRVPLTENELARTLRWLNTNGRPVTDGKTILFKRVSSNFKTRIGHPNETSYKIGTTVTIQNWNPREQECGSGKLHACYSPSHCDSYGNQGSSWDGNGPDRYIAIEIDVKDLYAWPNPSHPSKIAFRKGKVLYEVTQSGRRKADYQK